MAEPAQKCTATIDLVAGARPNFVKVAPVARALRSAGRFVVRIVHTGQHYDSNMDEVFFSELDIPEPYLHLDVGSGTHGQQTARILERYEAHLLRDAPSLAVVFGDVNSTVGCALAAAKLGVPIAHVEAGLRSFDRTMPEEVNRVLTDAIADLLFVTEPCGVANLAREGAHPGKVRLVGNVMIDTLRQQLARIDIGRTLQEFQLTRGEFALLSLHRPSNVDTPAVLERVLRTIRTIAEKDITVVFPVHPRTRAAAARFGLESLLQSASGFRALQPTNYRVNLALMASARLVATDSGGMQEESTVLGVPCITLRSNTERPITLSRGTSRLVGNDPAKIRRAVSDVLNGRWKRSRSIPLWDGSAAIRIASEIEAWLDSRG